MIYILRELALVSEFRLSAGISEAFVFIGVSVIWAFCRHSRVAASEVNRRAGSWAFRHSLKFIAAAT